MRDEFEKWAAEYPGAAALGDAAFKGAAIAHFVSTDLPHAINAAVTGPSGSRYEIEGSAGQSKWTYTPWVALLDPAVTTSVQEGYYIVYLLSADGRHLYLTLNQGCTALKDAIGIRGARQELIRRAANMRAKLGLLPKRLTYTDLDLGAAGWRASLYKAGEVVSIKYDTSRLPDEEQLVADLREALKLYHTVQIEGAWAAEDEMLKDAEADGLNLTLTQAKKYRQHRSIERQSKHAGEVKKALGTRCMGCAHEMTDIYGPIGDGLIHAHHLTPLSSLADDAPIALNPKTDFAVLCPNCHAIIHRMDDVGDVAGLKLLVTSNCGKR